MPTKNWWEHSLTIEILPYQPRWKLEFQHLGSSLRAAFGELALRHIGSTSVPELAAKDIIDIQVTVADLEHPRLQTVLQDAGFIWRDEIRSDHCPLGMILEPSQLEKRYAQLLPPKRIAHLHIRQLGRFNQSYALLCRDYLRSHTGTSQAYSEIKRQLVRYFPDNAQAYYDIKDPAFDLFMTGAWEWATWTNWQVTTSDA